MREKRSDEQARSPGKPIRRRPTPEWKLLDSIIYIRMRDRYLQREGILRQVGKRRWKLKVGFEGR